MKIVQPSFFVGDISIPNTQSSNVINNLLYFIDKYESSYLKIALGFKIEKLIREAESVSALPDLIKDLINGCTFSFEDVEYTWVGLSSENFSPISRYVYYKYVNATQSRFDGIGMIQSAPEENGTIPVSPSEKLVSVWAECSESTHVMLLLVLSKLEEYEEYDITREFIVRAALHFKKINIFGI